MPDSYLLIAHAEEPRASLLDAATLQVIRQYDMPGRVAVLRRSSDYQYGVAVHRDDDCVSFIHPAQTEIISITEVGEKPTHFHAHAGTSVLFNDGSGDVTLFNERNLPASETYPALQPDHGSALLIDHYLVVGYLRAGCVEVYRRGESHPLQTFDCCPRLHGAAQVGKVALFGCGDGVLLLKPRGNGQGFGMTKLDNPPDTPERVRVGTFATHSQSHVSIGNFGQGLAVIDTEAETMTTLPLPDKPLTFDLAPSADNIVVLLSDGTLYRLSLAGEVIHAVSATEPVEPPKGPDKKARPTFTIGNKTLYLVDPRSRTLNPYALTTFDDQQQTLLDFVPKAIVYLQSGR